MIDRRDYVGPVYINFHIFYEGEAGRDFKFCVMSSEATEMSALVLSLLPEENMTSLLMDRTFPTGECTINTREEIEATINKAFGRTPSTLTLEKGE